MSGSELAYSARAEYKTRDWNNAVRTIEVGSAFNPEVGFINRPAGFRFYDVSVMRLVRSSRWTRVRQWNPHTNFRGYFGLDGYYQNGQIHIDATEVEFNSGARFGPEFNVYHEGLQQPFQISPGVLIPTGSYDWGQLGFDFTTNPSAWFSFTGRADFGPFYDGTRNGGNVAFTCAQGLLDLVIAPAGLQTHPRPGFSVNHGQLIR